MSGLVLLGCGHAHLATLRHWRGPDGPLVVTRAAREIYSGLVPALLRGESVTAEMDLARVVAGAGGKLLIGDAVSLDLTRREIHLSDGRIVPFSLLSLDLGAAGAAPGTALPVRPAGRLLAAVARIEAGAAGAVAIVGGGAVGTELALALASRWRGGRPVVLVTPKGPLAAAPREIRRRAADALARTGVTVVQARAVDADAEGVILECGLHTPAVAVFWAAFVTASKLPRDAGLACDAAGFVVGDAGLRSVSHPFVFAAGDCAALGVAKSGAFAVASGRALARSLAAAGRLAPPWPRPNAALAIVGTGGGHALAWRGDAWLAGRPAWWLKVALDELWMRGLR